MVELVFGREQRGPRSHGRPYRLVAQVLRWLALIAAPALLRWSTRLFLLIRRLLFWIVALTAPVAREWSDRAFRFLVRVLRWAAAVAALAGLCWGLSVESRTSYFQSRIFSNLTREMSFVVEPGESPSIRFPKSGPYDERLGYVGLPMFLASLSAQRFTVQRQADWSAALDRFVDDGGYVRRGPSGGLWLALQS